MINTSPYKIFKVYQFITLAWIKSVHRYLQWGDEVRVVAILKSKTYIFLWFKIWLFREKKSLILISWTLVFFIEVVYSIPLPRPLELNSFLYLFMLCNNELLALKNDLPYNNVLKSEAILWIWCIVPCNDVYISILVYWLLPSSVYIYKNRFHWNCTHTV